MVARALGDRISDWILLNEAVAFTTDGYLTGKNAPGRKSLRATLRATHTANLAQGKGFRALKAEHPKARVGSAFNMSPCEPATRRRKTNSPRNVLIASATYGFWSRRSRADIPMPFDFPQLLMGVKPGDMEQVRAPLDFIGINLYDRTVVSAPSVD